MRTWIEIVIAVLFLSSLSWGGDLLEAQRVYPHSKEQALPHPPVRELPHDLDSVDSKRVRVPFSATFWADPSIQGQLDRLTNSVLTRNEEVRLYQNSTTLAPLIQMVERAERFIYIEALAVDCDDSTHELMEALRKKASSGKDVRLIVNRWFSWLSLSCLNDLKKAGIQVTTGQIHSSYIVTDRRELLIGAQSLARFFFKSDGFNALDRDSMLYVRGAVATDALEDFLAGWAVNRMHNQKDAASGIEAAKKAHAEERVAGTRDFRWTGKEKPRALCRFVGQAPQGDNRALQSLLEALISQSQRQIFGSGVKIGGKDVPLVRRLIDRSNAGVRVDFLGNGWGGGNGELTMAFDEWIERARRHGLSWIARLLGKARGWDQRHQMEKHFASFREILSGSKMTVWTHFGFVHLKSWSFDKYGVFVGSANPTSDAFDSFFEAGVLCMDESLAQDFEKETLRDLVNSVPWTKETL